MADLNSEAEALIASLQQQYVDGEHDWSNVLGAVGMLKRLVAARRAVPALAASHPVVEMLLDVARRAYDLMDNTDERGPEGHRELVIQPDDLEALSVAMDKLEDLPDDQPGYVMGPAAKAAWALRSAAQVPAQGEMVAKAAARWNFMMRVADDPDGPEAQAMERFGNDALESDRPESEQMGEIVDLAIAAAKQCAEGG